MDCPNKHKAPARNASHSDAGGELQKIHFHNVEVDACPNCLGIWFDKNELRQAKDERDKQLNWLDFDIWRDKGRFEFSKSQRLCPSCRTVLMETRYDDSKVKIDFCKHCQGIWLDRGEFKQIINYLKRKSDYEILHRYTKNLIEELWEVFAGPENFREELEDFLMLIKLLNYKFVVQHPNFNSWMENSPK